MADVERQLQMIAQLGRQLQPNTMFGQIVPRIGFGITPVIAQVERLDLCVDPLPELDALLQPGFGKGIAFVDVLVGVGKPQDAASRTGKTGF